MGSVEIHLNITFESCLISSQNSELEITVSVQEPVAESNTSLEVMSSKFLMEMNMVQACPVGDIDIESPAKDSRPHSVHVYSPLNRTENLLSASLTLPFHVRYLSPVAHGGYVTVELGAPSLLLHCQRDFQCVQEKRVRAPCGPCSQDKCLWVNLSYKTNSPSISLHVPVGNTSHHGLVLIVTLLVTCGGCVYILSAMAEAWPHTSSVRGQEKRIKQSPSPSQH
ncbi:phosphatidylinositol-glycan biosynthesis class X protein isoform X2 [Periplaneta americana]|uniref:phosphatidylinositol-glycan biosynthesis class X protein isoform X2 n=1 Tax=Periplaneta americana TaxID=6978 RepID=UPI0037E778BF